LAEANLQPRQILRPATRKGIVASWFNGPRILVLNRVRFDPFASVRG
jgi:hypothetical protein